MRRRLAALTATLIVVLPLSALAAHWQWSRHLEREVRNAQVLAAAKAPAVAYPGPMADGYDDRDRYRQVVATGRFLVDEQVLVRKTVVNGNVGFGVVTPLLTDDGVRLYVLRGWAAAPPQLAPGASDTPAKVTLRIDAVEPNGEMRPSDLPTGQVNWIDPAALSDGAPHADAVFVLVSPPDPPLVPIPEPAVSAGPHLGYTVQWVLIGLVAIIVYVRVLRREVQDSREN